jgi:hypothetical protein
MLTKAIALYIHCKKKVGGFPVPSGDVTYQTLPGGEYFDYSRPGESLVSDVPAGEGKITDLFYSVF